MNKPSCIKRITGAKILVVIIVFLLLLTSFQTPVYTENHKQEPDLFPPSPPTCNGDFDIRTITKLMQVALGIIEIPPEKKDLLREKLNKGEDEEITVTVRDVLIAIRPILRIPLSDTEIDKFERVKIIISVICTLEPNN